MIHPCLHRGILTALVALSALAGSAASAQEKRLAPAAAVGTASIGVGDTLLAEGDAIVMAVAGAPLKLRIDNLDVSPYGHRLLRAGAGSSRLQLVGLDDGTWQGQLTHDGAAYAVRGPLQALAVTPVVVETRRADRPVVRMQGEPVAPPPAASGDIQAQASTQAPTVLDVLVIREQAVSRIDVDLSVLYANDVFYTSRVPVQLRVLAEEVVPEMSGMLEDILDRAVFGREELDFPLPSAYGADLAAVFVEQPEDEETCGIANIGLFRFEGDLIRDPWLYSVTDVLCGMTIFAHEAGHNLGALHDRENQEDDSYAAFPYAFGHRDGLYGTTMSYAPIIDPYFSNPDIVDCGVQGKQPCGLPSGDENAADVARLFRFSAPLMAPIGDPFAQGAARRIIPGTVCKPRFPPRDNSVDWRDGALANRGAANADPRSSLDVICPLPRPIARAESGTGMNAQGLFVTLTLDYGRDESTPFPCTLSESVGNEVVYSYVATPVIGSETAAAYTVLFPRITPQDMQLSSLSVSCELPTTGVVQQLSITVTGQEATP